MEWIIKGDLVVCQFEIIRLDRHKIDVCCTNPNPNPINANNQSNPNPTLNLNLTLTRNKV